MEQTARRAIASRTWKAHRGPNRIRESESYQHHDPAASRRETVGFPSSARRGITNAPPATYGARRFVQWSRRKGHREICDSSGSFDKFLETPWSSARAPQCIEGVNSYRY